MQDKPENKGQNDYTQPAGDAVSEYRGANPQELQGKSRLLTRQNGVTPARFRQLFVNNAPKNLLDKALFALWSWKRWEYPGLARLRAWLIDADAPTASQYRLIPLPAVRSRIAAAKLRAKATELWTIAEELEAHAATRPEQYARAKMKKRSSKPRFIEISAPKP